MAINEDFATRNNEIDAINVIEMLCNSTPKIFALYIATRFKILNVTRLIPAQVEVCPFHLLSIRSPIDQVNLIYRWNFLADTSMDTQNASFNDCGDAKVLE